MKEDIQNNTSSKISEEEKKGYLTLVKYCVNPEQHNELNIFFENLNDYSKDENYLSTFNYVLEHFEKLDLFFIKYLDWKQDIKDLVWIVSTSLHKHFNLTIDLPNPLDYDENASISSPNVFNDFDECLRNYDLQIGFIDLGSDEYIIFIHKVEDIDIIEVAVNNIGFDYYEI